MNYFISKCPTGQAEAGWLVPMYVCMLDAEAKPPGTACAACRDQYQQAGCDRAAGPPMHTLCIQKAVVLAAMS